MIWPDRPVSSLASYWNGYAFKPEDVGNEGLPIVRIRQLLDEEAPADLFDGPVPQTNRIDSGDLIFSWSATLDCRNWDRGPAVLNQHLFRVDPSIGVEKTWLRWALLWSIDLFRSHMHGSAMSHVTRSMMKLVRVPLPPSPDQRVIADFLDCECERVRLAVRAASDATAALARSERTIADAVVHGLPCLPLKAVATIHSGVTLNEAKAPVDAIRVPYLRVANVKAGWLELDEIKEVPISPGDVPHYALKPGDLLLTEGGDLDKLGRGALWAGDISPCLFQNHIFAVRPRRDAAAPAFLSWATRSSAARSYFEATASRITNIASTNRSKLGRWPVPDAPVEEQRRRVAVAESAWQRAQHAITTARDLSDALTAYRSSLIHEAVTGKLDVTKASDRQMDERLHAAAEGRLDEVSV